MSAPAPGSRTRFWEAPLDTLTQREWEALCDGCGKCCLNKLEYEDTGEVAYTRVSCRLFDDGTCLVCCFPLHPLYAAHHGHLWPIP